MNTTTTTDLDLARERIETALRTYDFCGSCGEPMTIQAREHALWVECASLRGCHGIRFHLAAGLHDRHALDVPADDALPTAA